MTCQRKTCSTDRCRLRVYCDGLCKSCFRARESVNQRVPPPGSDEALDAGCRCPVMDSGHGRGYMGGMKDESGETMYVTSELCPLHWQNATKGATK